MDLNRDDLITKVKAGKELTREEELFYLTEVVALSQEHAERILAIAEQSNADRLID